MGRLEDGSTERKKHDRFLAKTSKKEKRKTNSDKP